MSLSPAEEAFLKKQVRDGSPLPSMNEIPQPTGFSPHVAQAALEKWKTEPKMAVKSLNDDPLVESRLRDAGFAGKPGEFYSTVGIGRAQLLAMSAAETRAAIESAKARDDFQAARRTPAPPSERPHQPRFVEVGG